jgi:hypothetical protein
MSVLHTNELTHSAGNGARYGNQHHLSHSAADQRNPLMRIFFAGASGVIGRHLYRCSSTPASRDTGLAAPVLHRSTSLGMAGGSQNGENRCTSAE